MQTSPNSPVTTQKWPRNLWFRLADETYDEYDSFLAYLGHCVRMAVDPARDGLVPPLTSVDTFSIHGPLRHLSLRHHWSARAAAWFLNFGLILQTKFPDINVPEPLPFEKRTIAMELLPPGFVCNN